MQQIADWLEKLGMSEYAQRFAENKIDVSVLRYGAKRGSDRLTARRWSKPQSSSRAHLLTS
jgi:hypothetical protein